MYGKGGATTVDGPASAFLCQPGLVRNAPYGWYHSVCRVSAPGGPVVGKWAVFTFSYGKASAGLRKGG